MINKIGLITYQTNHLKTEQVFRRLIKKYPPEVFTFYALPFVQRAKRTVLFPHRPEQSAGMDTAKLAKEYGVRYVICKSDTDISAGEDIYLILGAGILSAECVRGKKILNIHPGAIPVSRGLDAFKWAIYDGVPAGNTLHFIDAEVDAGETVALKATPLYEDDTFADFAARHYAREIDMMANFEEYLDNPVNDLPNLPVGEPRMRMKTETERELPEMFRRYKEKYAIKG